MRISRALSELQTRLRLNCTGSQDDVRQSYLQGLLSITVDPVITDAQAGIAPAIGAMDEYLLLPEDRDTLVELELDGTREAELKRVPAPVKSAFTRTYNASSQCVIANSPIAFQRSIPNVKTKEIRSADVPDNEEAYGVRICLQADEEAPEEEQEETDDVAADKLIRTARPKARRPAK